MSLAHISVYDMINSYTVDSHHLLCYVTSSRVGFIQDVKVNPVLSSDAPSDKQSEAEMASRPISTKQINNFPVREARSINSLPNNLLHLIFSYLDVRERFKSELVCKKWRLIGKLLPWSNPVTLSFTEKSTVTPLGIPITELTDNILLSLLMRCGACLATLELTFASRHKVQLTCKSIENIGTYCPNLEVLRLEGIYATDDNVLKIIALSCRQLREFHVGYISNNESKEGVLDILRKCETLESISIHGLNLAEKLFDVTGSRLSEIRFTTCTQVENALQNLMANTQITLRNLNMCFFRNLMGADESVWFAVIDRFKVSLQSLTASQIGRPINLNWCEGLKNLHNLVTLALMYYPSINDDLIAVIVNQCPELQVLDLPGSNITDTGVAALNSLAHLTELDISQNRNVSARGLTDLVRRDALEILCVRCAPRITEEFCCSLAKKCPNLKELDVSGSKHMTKRLVAAFRDAVEAGFRQESIKLCVGRTSVKGKVKTCKGVEVEFNDSWKVPVLNGRLVSFFHA